MTLNCNLSKFCCILYFTHVEFSRQGEYWLEQEEGKIKCASGHSIMYKWSSPFPGQWLAVSPGVAMLTCIYTGPLIDIFCLPARHQLGCRDGKCCYYFILCIRAVVSSQLMVRITFWRVWSTPSLPLLPGPLIWSGSTN